MTNDLPRAFYHGTSSVHLPSIRVNGLRNPFLCDSYEKAHYYAEVTSEGSTGGQPVVLEIPSSSVEPTRLRYDGAAMDESVMADEEARDDAWDWAGRQHPEWVERVGKEEFISCPPEAWQVSWLGVGSVWYDGTINVVDDRPGGRAATAKNWFRSAGEEGHYWLFPKGPKSSGKLDTQMYPECAGTKYDRDIVKKTRKRRRRKLATANADDDVLSVFRRKAEAAVSELGGEVVSSRVVGGVARTGDLSRKDVDVLVTVRDASAVLGKWTLGPSFLGRPVDIFVTDGKATLVGRQISPQSIRFVKMPAVKTAGTLPPGSPRHAPKDDVYVYHNCWARDLPAIAREGMDAGSFSDRPLDFGRDAWVAVRRRDFPGVIEQHQYGDVVAYEPVYNGAVVPAGSIMLSTRRGRVVGPLADHIPDKTAATVRTELGFDIETLKPIKMDDLRALRGEIAAAANAVLDEWQQDDDGMDPTFGAGGACDQVATAVAGVLAEHGYDTYGGGQDGDDHAWVVVHDGRIAVSVDIPPSVYETGGGYVWRKRDGASVKPEDVEMAEVGLEAVDTEAKASFGFNIVSSNAEAPNATTDDLPPDKWIPVESSAVEAVAYFEPLGMMEFKLKDGREYSFKGVPRERFDAMMSPGASKGKTFAELVKEKATAEKAVAWTWFDANEYLRNDLVPKLRKHGFAARIVGGVRVRGQSSHNLDVLVVPTRDDSDFDPLRAAIGGDFTTGHGVYEFSDPQGRLVDLHFGKRGDEWKIKATAGKAADGFYGSGSDILVCNPSRYMDMVGEASAVPGMTRTASVWGRAGSGMLYLCPDDQTAFLVLRAPQVADPDVWGIPGGAVKGTEGWYDEDDEEMESFDDETLRESAEKETVEEIGYLPRPSKELGKVDYRNGGFVYTTFVVEVSAEEKRRMGSMVRLNRENVSHGWHPVSSLPADLHPGVAHVMSALPGVER